MRSEVLIKWYPPASLKNYCQKISSLLPMLLLFFCVQAQEHIYPDFGIPSSDDFSMTSCSFDKNAEAVYLKKEAKVFPDDYKMVSIHRVRIKILKESGVEHANIRIPYYHANQFEFITDIKAVVINGSGITQKKSELSQKDIYRKKQTEYHSYVIFTLPEVHAGSIIEYSYTSIRQSYKSIDYWYFQDELPVVQSNFHFVVLPSAEFNYRVLKTSNYNCDVKNDNHEGSVSFTMKNLPGVPDEQYMDSRNDYLQRVELQLAMIQSRGFNDKFVSSWMEAAKELSDNEDFGRAIKGFSGAGDIVKTASLITDPLKKMSYIYYAVKERMDWNGYVGISASDRLKKAWENRKGTCPDINLILISILKDASIPAMPLLVSERGHGRVDKTQPYLNQFNKVIAYVDLGDRDFFLDATDDLDNVKLIPAGLLNTTGFLVDRKEPGFVQIGDDQYTERKIVSINGKLDTQGLLTGATNVLEYDYSRAMAKSMIKRDQDGYLNKYFIKPYKDNNIAIDSFKVDNLENDSLALAQKFQYKLLLKPNGDYMMLSLNLFSGNEKNPFVADERYTDINFGSKQSFTSYINYEISDGLTVESLPKNITLLMADKSIRFQRTIEVSNGGTRISALVKIDILKPTYNPGEYPTLKEFYKKMFAMIDEPVLIKVKK